MCGVQLSVCQIDLVLNENISIDLALKNAPNKYSFLPIIQTYSYAPPHLFMYLQSYLDHWSIQHTHRTGTY